MTYMTVISFVIIYCEMKKAPRQGQLSNKFIALLCKHSSLELSTNNAASIELGGAGLRKKEMHFHDYDKITTGKSHKSTDIFGCTFLFGAPIV